MDLAKLPARVIVTVAIVVATALAFVGLASAVKQEPFMIYGKEFGFGSVEQHKIAKELSSCREQFSSLDSAQKTNLAALEEINRTLRSKLTNLQTELAAATSKNAAPWFPVDDIHFSGDGTAIAYEATNAKGRVTWKGPDGELTLRAISIGNGEVVLETNLPAPGNLLRLTRAEGFVISRPKWDYRLKVTEIYAEDAHIRVERRSR